MKWWKGVVGQEIRKIIAYRSDFWVTFIGQTLIQLFIARALWNSIFESQGVSSMKGLDLNDMTIYYIIAPIGTRIIQGESFGFLFREIYEGTFSKYLLYPLSFVQYKTLTYMTNSLFFMLQLILIVTLYRFFYLGVAETFSSTLDLLAGSALFLLAAFVYVNLAMTVELISLWADNVWSLLVMLRFFMAFLGGGFIPLVFYPEWSLKIIHLTPYPYLISLPIRTIMGQTTGSEIAEGVNSKRLGWVSPSAISD